MKPSVCSLSTDSFAAVRTRTVAPPAGAKIHIWADAFLRDLALPWTIAREAHAWPEPAGATIRPERPQAAVPGGDLLAIINSELPELSRPVHVFKSLPVTAPQVAPTSAPAPGARKPAGPAPTPGVLLALADGAPLILASPPGAKEATGTPEVASAASPPPSRGLVVLFTTTFAFDWSDLQATPLMVPLMQEVLRQGVGQARGSWTGLAGSAPTVPPRTIELRAAAPETTPASIRASGERTAEPLRRSGLWRAIDDTGTGRGLVALNADPAGARCDAQPRAAIASWLGSAIGGGEVRWLDDRTALGAGGASLRSALQRGEDGTRLAFPLLIAALLFAVTELALARWFSHAVVRPPAPGLPEAGA